MSAGRALRFLAEVAVAQSRGDGIQARRALRAYRLLGALRRAAVDDPASAAIIVRSLLVVAWLARPLLTHRRGIRALAARRYVPPRAFEDADLIAAAARSRSLKDLSRRLGAHRSTVSRRLAILSRTEQSATPAAAFSPSTLRGRRAKGKA